MAIQVKRLSCLKNIHVLLSSDCAEGTHDAAPAVHACVMASSFLKTQHSHKLTGSHLYRYTEYPQQQFAMAKGMLQRENLGLGGPLQKEDPLC